MKKLRVCVIMGGKSCEHDISILSGLQVYHAIDNKRYHKKLIYITKDNHMLVNTKLKELKTFQKNKKINNTEIILINKKGKSGYLKYGIFHPIDIFIPVLHGEGAEDGTITAYLDFINAPYTSADLTSSSIAQDKIYTKDILNNYNIKTPKYISIDGNIPLSKNIEIINNTFSFPVMVKPSRLGSSIGITKANENNIKSSLQNAFLYTNRLIIEEVIENVREYNCAAFRKNNQIITSYIEEVHHEKDILSFQEKYESRKEKTKDDSNRTIPAVLKEHIENTIKEYTQKIYEVLNMNGIVRIDYLYDEKKDILYFNEINTIPGSLSFYLFERMGIDFATLIDYQIKDALLRNAQKKNRIAYFSSSVLQKNCPKLTK